MKATRIPCTPDGFAPRLAPGEYCQDAIHGLLHCCAPDGSRFAAGGDNGKTAVLVSEDGVYFLSAPPAYCFYKNERVQNHWEIHGHDWLERKVA